MLDDQVGQVTVQADDRTAGPWELTMVISEQVDRYGTSGRDCLGVRFARSAVTLGQRIFREPVKISSGNLQLGVCAHLFSGSGTPNAVVTGASGGFSFRTDTPGTAKQRLSVCTGGIGRTAIL